MLRIISANVNGIRSAHSKGFFEWILSTNADVLCVQETKAQEQDLTTNIRHLTGYHSYFFSAQKKGYSGVAVYCKTKPLHIQEGFGVAEFDDEGRFILAEFDAFKVVSVYFPSGSSSPDRQLAKFRFLECFDHVLTQLETQPNPVILCGDVNIAHQTIDLKNWKGNLKNSGFLPEERAWMDHLLHHRHWTDSYRSLHPTEEAQAYTWWSNRGQARANNVGWRIDYQLLSPHFKNSGTSLKLNAASVYRERAFSDHAPLVVDFEVL